MIYIVEDDGSVRRSLEILLESAGLEFKSFASAELFLSDVSPLNHDLLLLDIKLPGMNGLDLLDTLVQEKKSIPAIVITSVEDEHTRKACKRYGVKALLRKPVDSETLIDLIHYHRQA